MKTVFTDASQVAHLWANELQSEAKNSHHNFFFDCETIYSYGRHFPIARHVKNANGESAILFTEQTYSVTTSKHISITRQAISHKNVIYCYYVDGTKADNFRAWQNECEGIAANLVKAKKPEKYLTQISHVKHKVETYATFFNVEIPTPLLTILSIGNKDEYLGYAKVKADYEAEQKRKSEIELKKRHKKELKSWIEGKTHRLYVRDGYDYLRVNGDKVETSQGVELSVAYGLKIYNRLKDGKLKVGDKVLDFQVIKINGVVTIGCHNFKKSYLLSFGEKLQSTAQSV